jgi:hypothetical protein
LAYRGARCKSVNNQTKRSLAPLAVGGSGDMRSDHRRPLQRPLGLLAGLSAVVLTFTACSSTPSATPTKRLQIVVDGNRSNVVDLVSVVVVRYADTKSSTDPNTFENAGAASRYAAFSLRNYTWPKSARSSVENLRAALLKLSDDLEQAAGPQANLATVKQITAVDATNMGTANQALLAKLPLSDHWCD